MDITPVVRAKVSMTLSDLRILAWVMMREVTGPDKKIATIRKMRDMLREVEPVDTYGQPLRQVIQVCAVCEDETCSATRSVPVLTFGLKECKDAVDAWFVDRQFIG